MATPTFKDQCIDEARPIRVVIIGAGFAGILAAIRFRQKFTNASIQLYEKHSGVGGTWRVNTYPGVAVDTPAHAYTYSFENNPYLSTYYAPGPEILKYLEHVGDKYKVHDLAKYNHELLEAKWDEITGSWVLTVKDIKLNTTFEDHATFVVQATGLLNEWEMPRIDGLAKFKGKMFHSAHWDPSYQAYDGKRIAVIGLGASAIQIISTLQAKCKEMKVYSRSKAWVVGRRDHDLLNELGMDSTSMNPPFPKEVQERFASDPEFHKAFRARVERSLCSMHQLTVKDSPMNKAAGKMFKDAMLKELVDHPDVASHLIPDWPVTCRRINPAPGFLKALTQPNVESIWSDIDEITETGIRTKDGRFEEFDLIACATGFKNTWVPRFKVTGINGATLEEKYAGRASTYFTVATDGIPNWVQIMGPGSGFGTGQILLAIDTGVNYAIATCKKIQMDRIKSISVKSSAVQDFMRYCDSYFPQSTFSAGCSAWYKRDNQVVGVYPGSVQGFAAALAHPRWEDYDIKYLSWRFENLGNGSTIAERDGGETAAYLLNIDLPPIPGVDEPEDSWRRRQAAAPMPPLAKAAGYSAANDQASHGKLDSTLDG